MASSSRSQVRRYPPRAKLVAGLLQVSTMGVRGNPQKVTGQVYSWLSVSKGACCRGGATGKIVAVATWREFEASAPGVAETACLVWPGITALHRGELTKPASPWFSIAYLATSRPDGSPRLHPFCPILAGGRLFAAIPGNSPKGHDLRRDPRLRDPCHARP